MRLARLRMTKKRGLIVVIVIIALAISFFYFENNAITTSTLRMQSDKLPSGFDRYRIVQLSDLHSKMFGDNQRRLVRKVSKLKPDLIVVTGDLVDARRYNAENSLTAMREMLKLAPVYFVTGNHERRSGRYDQLEEGLIELGVHVMRNAGETIKLGDGSFRLIGIDDPAFYGYMGSQGADERIRKALDSIDEEANNKKEGSFTVLLSHRPELFDVYTYNHIDLTFSGHAHGGQIRLPFLGGLIAPNQGYFPRYDAGKFESGSSTMVVSRGLGNSLFPLRVFNRPEVIMVELTR
ncbi:putative MPP superfamily phosphohydrolase [Paenibacillus harenae]|uniref:MPP superfamily phosphohydrolase n=2 Tax=Paenibacillus harenae TaxID=306543 RepID=A0ABT9U675_PAEHA|nr:putative MPP superfamily phosphohydrolase [Paenibacillus harenae]